MSPSTSALSLAIRSGSYDPRISELRHVASVSVPDTTYLVVSLKNGAPGSWSAVRDDHAGSNIWYVSRPSRIALHSPVIAASVFSISGSNPYSNVHVGASMMPSRVMNSCTRMPPMAATVSAGLSVLLPDELDRVAELVARLVVAVVGIGLE